MKKFSKYFLLAAFVGICTLLFSFTVSTSVLSAADIDLKTADMADMADMADAEDTADLSVERILSFQDRITVDSKGDMRVVENIKFNVTGQTIKHGIYRDFPTTYTNEKGIRFKVGFTVEQVLRNGEVESYKLESLTNGTRVKIGKADTLIESGVHTYTIVYKTNRQIGFYEKFDELYWNVTGNGWDYPIDYADVEVTFPETVRLSDNFYAIAFTGPVGSTERGNASSKVVGGQNANSVYIETNKKLLNKEGLTIKIGIPKGHIIPPTKADNFFYFLKDNSLELLSFVLALCLLLYYSILWRKIGKDPAMPAISAHYEAPREYSPAVIRYLNSFSFDNQTLSAIFVQMAVKKYITITKKTTLYHFDRNISTPDSVLSEEELLVAKEIFRNDETHFAVREEDYNIISDSISKAKESVASRFGVEYFSLNRKVITKGVTVSIICLFCILILQGFPKFATISFTTLWLTLWTAGTTVLLSHVYKIYKTSKIQSLFLGVFSLAFVAGWFLGFFIMVSTSSYTFAVILALIIFTHILFYKVMPQRTPLGMKIESEIEGFKKFLTMTEKDRMNFHNPPEKTPELFEKFLPYALALGVDNKWANQFTEVFASLDSQGHSYSPSWYHGPAGAAVGSAFASSFGSSISSSVSSASTPASSSGGGGGSSGGGGGGGGGGGW